MLHFMNVTLLDSEKIKRYLTLKFKGVYGIGSQGNEDADYIINCLKDFISNDNSIQGVICDFSEMEYTFGNRLAKIFDTNLLRPNKALFVRIIPRSTDYRNWKSLIEECTSGLADDYLMNSTSTAIKDMNRKINQ